MDFDFIDQPAIVHEKRKYQNFKVTEIGGPNEIILWRRQQEAKEATYRMRLATRDQRLGQFEAETGQKLVSPTIQTSSWAEKKAFAESERERLAKVEDIAFESYVCSEEPKKTFLQKIMNFFVGIYKSANF